MAQSTPGAGSISDPSAGTTIGSPFTAATLSPLTQPLAGPSTGNHNMFMTPPPMVGAASLRERMVDVGLWAAESNDVDVDVDVDVMSDSGSEHDSDEEFVDADSDGDTDIESVTDM
ncbi:hypothetical protein FRC10_008880 [Ceratobasidium sp. 414]|nr:hypothetical protein FRC10_008880 [Ceratobasidium sp. 414]